MSTRAEPQVSQTATMRRAARVVRVGLAISFTLMLVGLAVHVVDGGQARAVGFGDLLSATEPGDRILLAGTLTLALTPVVQVLTLLVGWLRIRDLRYAGVAALVVAVLTVAAFLGG